MFIGYYESRCTQKNQLTFPSKFTEITGKKLFITTWFENSLLILPHETFKETLARMLSDKSELLPEARDLERYFFGNAAEIELGGKNRFVIPASLKEFAKIGNEAVFVGVSERIELWDKDIYANYGKIREVQIRNTAVNLYNQVLHTKNK